MALSSGKDIRLSEWSARMLKAQALLLKLAEKNLRHRDLKHGLENFHFQKNNYDVNSYVLAGYPDGVMGRRLPTKFHPKHIGPFRVSQSPRG